MNDVTTLPRALILSHDARLSRLLETELSYLGVSARTAEALPPPDEGLCLLLADGDEFSLSDCVGLAESCGCLLLMFGREVTALPLPPERGVFLRRPFGLDELETTVRGLLTGVPLVGGAVGMTATRPMPKTPEAVSFVPTLAVENGTVTVAGKPLPLTPAEAAIFECLYAHRGETVTKEALFALLEGGGNSVEVYICKLRAKIEKPLGRRMISTVRGVGYRMDI